MDQNNGRKQLNQNNGGRKTDNQNKAKTTDIERLPPLPPADDVPKLGGPRTPCFDLIRTIADLDPALQALARLGSQGPSCRTVSNGNANWNRKENESENGYWNVTRGYTGWNIENSPTSVFNPDDVDWGTSGSLSSKPLLPTRCWVPWYHPKTGKRIGYIYRPDPILNYNNDIQNAAEGEDDEEEMDSKVVMDTVMSLFDDE